MALLHWQNLIFLLPMLAALAYTLLMAAGLGFGDHGIEVDHDLDVGHDFDAGAEHDLDTDHDAGHLVHVVHAGPRHGETARPIRRGQGSPLDPHPQRSVFCGGQSAWH